MDAQAFWNVIERYNEQTGTIQTVLLIGILIAILFSYIKRIGWIAKFALGIANLFIGIAFFACYGTEPIQKYFAFPLYLLCGALFLYEGRHTKDDVIQRPNQFQALLLLLYMVYPFVSVLLGNRFPQMVTYIMPCPIASLSIAVYTCYKRKNKCLLALLTLWGLTGIKSVVFHAYEDIILLVCGLYGGMILISEMKRTRRNEAARNGSGNESK